MTTPGALDTLAYARRLMAAGVSRQQAEAHAEALHEAAPQDIATKADIESIKQFAAARIEQATNRITLALIALAALATTAIERLP